MVPILSAWGTFRIGEVAALTTSSIDGDRIRIRNSVATAGSTVYLKGPKSAAQPARCPAPGVGHGRTPRTRSSVREPRRLPVPFPHRKPALAHQLPPDLVERLRACGFAKPWPRAHDLPHTAVALVIRAGAHPKQIQARCGHATMKESMDTYGHLFRGHDEELVRTLESFRTRNDDVVMLSH